MKTGNFAVAARAALLAGLTATCVGAAAADKDADDQTTMTKGQPQKDPVETTINIDPAIAGTALPQAKIPAVGIQPAVPGFSGAAQQRIEQAVEAEQARGLREMKNLKALGAINQGIKNLGAIDDEGGSLVNRGQNDPLDNLGRRRNSDGGLPDYVSSNP